MWFTAIDEYENEVSRGSLGEERRYKPPSQGSHQTCRKQRQDLVLKWLHRTAGP